MTPAESLSNIVTKGTNAAEAFRAYVEAKRWATMVTAITPAELSLDVTVFGAFPIPPTELRTAIGNVLAARLSDHDVQDIIAAAVNLLKQDVVYREEQYLTAKSQAIAYAPVAAEG